MREGRQGDYYVKPGKRRRPRFLLTVGASAQIYLHQGKRDLALELYKKALDLLDRKRDFLLSPNAHSQERNLIQKKVDALQNQLNDQHLNSQHK
jgi:tetratricopeptide (TPR) repeat protein